MPTYTYACSDCGERFDAVQSIHDAALTECPACGGSVRRVISAVGVAFKGSGFYRTDSRSGSSSTKTSASSSSGTSPSGGSSTGSSSGDKSGGSTSAGASPA